MSLCLYFFYFSASRSPLITPVLTSPVTQDILSSSCSIVTCLELYTVIRDDLFGDGCVDSLLALLEFFFLLAYSILRFLPLMFESFSQISRFYLETRCLFCTFSRKVVFFQIGPLGNDSRLYDSDVFGRPKQQGVGLLLVC